MATYQQEQIYYEDNFGKVKITFKLSDLRESLFENSSVGTPVFNGEGENRLYSSGTFSGSIPKSYEVKISTVLTGEITAFADEGGGLTRVVCSHTVNEGDTITITDTTNYNGIYEVVTVGSGYFTISAVFVATGTGNYEACYFQWSEDNGETWSAEISVSEGIISLSNGVNINFGAVAGHTIENFWRISTTMILPKDLFKIGDVQTEREIGEGELCEDELTLELNEAAIETELEEAASNFILEAQNEDNIRYCGLFIGSQSDLVNDEIMVFIGAVLPDMNAKALKWHGSEFTTAPDPLFNWKIKAAPMIEYLFDKVTIDEITDTLANDTEWIEANVENKPGHYKGANGNANLHSEFASLVNLSSLIEKLYETGIQLLKEKELGEASVQFHEANIDGIFRPTRWCHVVQPDFSSPGNFKPYHFVSGGGADSETGGLLPFRFPDDDPDKRPLSLFSDSETSTPFINFRCIKNLGDCINESLANQYLWKNHSRLKGKSLTDLLYLLAENFCMFPELYFTSDGTFHISFKARSGVTNPYVYIKGVTSDDLDTTPTEAEQKKEYYGDSFYLALEGDSFYTATRGETDIQNENPYQTYEDRSGEKLLLTTSPTQKKIMHQYYYINRPSLPHNMILKKTSTDEIREHFTEKSNDVHTGIYMKVSPYGSELGEPDYAYWTPAGAWGVKIGDTVTWKKLMGRILNLIYKNDTGYFRTERKLELPYLMGFSASADGSNPHQKNLRLWSQITIDTKSYVIIGITRNIEKRTTMLRLQNSSRFAFYTPDTFDEPEIPAIDTTDPTNSYPAGEAINAGDIVIMNPGSETTARSLWRAKAQRSHYKKQFGIALQSGSPGDYIPVHTPEMGELSLDVWPEFTKQAAFLRNNESGVNISNTCLREKNDTEDLYLSLQVTGYKTLMINFNRQYIYE